MLVIPLVPQEGDVDDVQTRWSSIGSHLTKSMQTCRSYYNNSWG